MKYLYGCTNHFQGHMYLLSRRLAGFPIYYLLKGHYQFVKVIDDHHIYYFRFDETKPAKWKDFSEIAQEEKKWCSPSDSSFFIAGEISKICFWSANDVLDAFSNSGPSMNNVSEREISWLFSQEDWQPQQIFEFGQASGRACLQGRLEAIKRKR